MPLRISREGAAGDNPQVRKPAVCVEKSGYFRGMDLPVYRVQVFCLLLFLKRFISIARLLALLLTIAGAGKAPKQRRRRRRRICQVEAEILTGRDGGMRAFFFCVPQSKSGRE